MKANIEMKEMDIFEALLKQLPAGPTCGAVQNWDSEIWVDEVEPTKLFITGTPNS